MESPSKRTRRGSTLVEYRHTGGGPGSVSAVYAFPDRPDRPVVAVFKNAQGDALAEEAAIALAG